VSQPQTNGWDGSDGDAFGEKLEALLDSYYHVSELIAEATIENLLARRTIRGLERDGSRRAVRQVARLEGTCVDMDRHMTRLIGLRARLERALAGLPDTGEAAQ
jgi:hypothetical protein